MTPWLSSLLWCAAAVSVLIQTQVHGATSVVDPSDLIPFFGGITDRNPQPPIAAGAMGTTADTEPALDPLEFSPDAPKAPLLATQAPEAAPATPSAGTTVSTDTTATNTTASATPSTDAGEAPSPQVSHRCSDELSQMSVENVPGVFCVKGPRICSGSLRDGNCPGVQDGLPLGSHCGMVYTGVYGCQTVSKPA